MKKFDGNLDADLSWKIRWRMANDKNPLFPILSDKYRIKEYAKNLAIKTAKLLFVTTNPNDIPFDTLPTKYLIKANHASEWNIACIDSQLYYFGYGDDLISTDGTLIKNDMSNTKKLSQEEVINICTSWLNTEYSPQEWGYQDIPRVIIIEEMLESIDNKELKDYKMYTFCGVVKAIDVCSPSIRKNDEMFLVDTNWKQFELTIDESNKPNYEIAKPKNFDTMLEYAHMIGKDFDFLRTDFFETKDGVYLSEITLYPSTGDDNTPTLCPIFNKWLASFWI